MTFNFASFLPPTLPMIPGSGWLSGLIGTRGIGNPLTPAASILRVIEAIAACGAAVTTAELFVVRHALHDDGLLSWRVFRLYHPRLARWLAVMRLNDLLNYPAVLGLLGIRLLAALLLIAGILLNHAVSPALYVLTVTSLLLTLRQSSANDGSDQMALILLVVLSGAEFMHTQFAAQASVVFIAAQSALSYGTSGVLKAGKKGWRDGSYVTEILATSSFGHRGLFQIFQSHALLRKWCGRFVVYGDCLLATAALLPPAACLLVLAFGVSLHLGIARILGLNTFLLAFVATYPAVWYVSVCLYRHTL